MTGSRGLERIVCADSNGSRRFGILGNCMGLICKAERWMVLSEERTAQEEHRRTEREPNRIIEGKQNRGRSKINQHSM